MQTKKCTKCNTIKQFELFHNKTESLDGKKTICKACCSKYNKKYHVSVSEKTTMNGLVKSLPSRDTLNSLFDYDNGFLIRKIASPGGKVGTIVTGKVEDSGYVALKIKGALYKYHRIVMKMLTGNEPEQVDHINRVRSDNRIENLRCSNRSENIHNSKINCNNTSGFYGVRWFDNGKNQYWCASISCNNERQRIYTKNLKYAVNWYNSMATKYSYEFAKDKIAHNKKALLEYKS